MPQPPELRLLTRQPSLTGEHLRGRDAGPRAHLAPPGAEHVGPDV